jgi:hypothetical protein
MELCLHLRNLVKLKYPAIIMLACSIAAAGKLTVEIPVEPSSLNLSQAGIYTRITGTGMELISDTGAPCLPVYSERIALPTGCCASGIRILNVSFMNLTGMFDIMPVQPSVPVSEMDWPFELVRPDPEIYSASYFYPPDPVVFTGSGVISGIPVACVRVFPVRWNPSSRVIEIMTDISIEVTYDLSPLPLLVRRRSFNSESRSQEIVGNMVVNPEGVSGSGAELIDSRDLEYGEYVIIATPEYQAFAQELADWKTSKGIPSSVYLTDWIENQYYGYDLQQKIRAFLTNCRDEGVEYVLIYGDDDIIPGRDVRLVIEPLLEEYPPVDLYWSDINDMIPGADMWDSNCNYVWGEYGLDNVDYHPDIWVGRASVNSLDECEIFNQKVFIYEGVYGSDYFENDEPSERMGYTTGEIWTTVFGSSSAEIISEIVPATWEEEKCYQSTGSNSVDITDSMLNAGPHHVYHASHGSPTGFALPDGEYSTDKFMNLTNISSGGLPAIWNSMSCSIGHIDDYECMADAWLNSPEGGGFGAFNARAGFADYINPGYGPSEVLARYFYEVMWNDDQFNLGVAHLIGMDEMVPPQDVVEDWCMKEYNLLGDPELPMWICEPSVLEASHTASISQATTVTISVSSDGIPVEDARVCLQKGDWQTGDIYLIGFTDALGECSFYVNPASTGEISVVAWARDYISYTGTIEVTSTGGDEIATECCINSIGEVYPCPAYDTANIPFSLAGGGMTGITIYDLSGRVVSIIAAEEMTPGENLLEWDLRDNSGTDIPSGLYCVQIKNSTWTAMAWVLVLK